MKLEKLQQCITLCFLELRKPSHEPGVHVKSFEASDRMRPDGGVVSIDGWTVGLCTP